MYPIESRKTIKSIYERLSNNSMNELKAVWREAWMATVSSDNCNNPEAPTRYADIAVVDYFERFIESQLLLQEESDERDLKIRRSQMAEQGIQMI